MMYWKYLFKLISFWLIICLSSSTIVIAQTSALEIWPEIDLFYRLSPHWSLSSYISSSKNVESKYREGSINLQADYSWGRAEYPFFIKVPDEYKTLMAKAWLTRGGFMEARSLQDEGENYSEDMVYAELHKRNLLTRNTLLSQRIRTEFRWIGLDPDFSYRFRYRVLVEKYYTIKNVSVVPYISAEVFWDSRYDMVDRLRMVGGGSLAWDSRFAIEGNLTYIYDTQPAKSNVYAINVVLLFFFERTKAETKK